MEYYYISTSSCPGHRIIMKICTKCKLEKDEEKDFGRIKNKGFRAACKKCLQEDNKIYKIKHREKYKAYKMQYDKIYRKKNAVKIAKDKKVYHQKVRYQPKFKIKRNLRRRIHHAINGKIKFGRTFELIGCDADFFKSYIESLWKEGMTWENYGPKGWHIDHIIPCYKFDLSIPEEQKRCFHYKNQRPLWAKDNLSRPRFT